MYGRTPSYGHGSPSFGNTVPAGYGYGQQQQLQHHHRYPPAGADPQLWQWFSSVDSDGNGTITATELQQALVNGAPHVLPSIYALLFMLDPDSVAILNRGLDKLNFDLDTVKMLMGIFDTDRSGTIGYNEFAGLWKYISDWQGVFRHFDQDRSGSIDRHELSNALRSFGYNLTPPILMLIEQKYATPPSSNYGPPPGITFDRFVRACVAVKTLTEAFQRMDVQRSGWIQINYEQFMQVVLSAP